MAITMEGNRAGPCPNCGGMGSIPNGTFDFVEGAIKVLAAPQRTIDDLKRLSVILEDARHERVSRAEAVCQVGRVDLTLASSLGKVVKANEATWTARLTLLFVAVTLTVQLRQSQPPATTINNVTVNVNPTVEQRLRDEDLAKLFAAVFERACRPIPAP